MELQHVSSYGGPRVLLPTSQVARWIDSLDDHPTPDAGLYGLACSVDSYCGVISPWGIPFLIFGDEPSDIFWVPEGDSGFFVRALAADSIEQLINFARQIREDAGWDERTMWTATESDLSVIDTCANGAPDEATIQLTIPTGRYEVLTKYVLSDRVETIVHELQPTSGQ